MNAPPPIIQTQGLTRRFKENTAVDSLDLAIRPGTLFGLVGPDGAGKTTTLRLLAGLLGISEGSAEIDGHDLAKDPEAVKSSIGYMAQQFSLYGELSVAENLHFFAEVFDVPPAEQAARTERLLAFAGLQDSKTRRAAHLSGGMQKKLALACTLIHEPRILLLDEPTTGVDPISRREFWHILTELHLQGTTIIVSTPYMDEADRCSWVGLMYAGKMVVQDSPRAIRDRLHGEIVALTPEAWEPAIRALTGLPGVRQVQTYGETLHLIVDSADKRLPQIEHALRKQGVGYSGARQSPPRMEEAFISLIREMEAREASETAEPTAG